MKLLLLLPLLLIPLIPCTFHYDREAYLWAEFADGGCAFSDCPHWLQEKTLAETGGVYPPSYYERGTKAWMRAFCTYSPEECK